MDEMESLSTEMPEFLDMVLSTEEMKLNTEVGETSQDVPEVLQSIDEKLGIIVFLFLFSFCWSCMRHWRNNVLKGV